MIKKIAVVVATFGIMFSFAGCGSDAGTGGTSNSVRVDLHEKVNISGDDDVQIYMVTLSDGTKCAVSDGYKSGGISCDWN